LGEQPKRIGQLVGEGIRRVWETATRLATIYSGDPRSKRFYSFGTNSCVCFPYAAIMGYDRIAIGTDTMVGPYSTLSAGLPYQPPRPSWAGPTLTIGDRCLVGRNATVTAHREIVIEDDVWMGNEVFISDQNHAWDDPDRSIGQQAQDPRPVRIGAGSWIGKGAIILPGSIIGKRVVIAAGAVVTGPVPDFSIVGGVPAQVIGTTASDKVVTPIQPVRPA
jgi:acetyltransferase-like isoleucine patch superfamily enzyme